LELFAWELILWKRKVSLKNTGGWGTLKLKRGSSDPTANYVLYNISIVRPQHIVDLDVLWCW